MSELHGETPPLWDKTIDQIDDSPRSYLRDVVVVNPDLAAHLRIKANFYRAAALARIELFGSCDDPKPIWDAKFQHDEVLEREADDD